MKKIIFNTSDKYMKMYIIIRNKNYASMFKMLRDVSFNYQPVYVVDKKDHDIKLALMDHGYFRNKDIKFDDYTECYTKHIASLSSIQ